MSQRVARTTLHQQLVRALRRDIADGRWNGELPSEGELGRDFQVSRMTLRKAIAQLVSEGRIIPGGRGRRHRLHGGAVSPRVVSGRVVRVLTPFGIGELSTTDHSIFESLQDWASRAGYRIETEKHPGLFRQFQASRLRRLDARPDTAAWVCCYGTEAIHRWLAESGRPTMILGRVHGELPLASVYPDTRAAARHAAGQLHRRGHRELVYLIGNPTSLGDRLASEVFVGEAERLGANARIHSHNSTSTSIRRLMSRLAASPRPPTGFVVGSPEGAVAVLCCLLAARVRVPTEAGVLAMWDDSNLDATVPTVARYRCNGSSIGRLVGRTLQELIEHGPAPRRSIPVVPDFVDGGSLGPVDR